MVEECRDYFVALHQLAKVVNSSLEPRDVLKGIVNEVSKTLNAKASAIRVLDSKGESLMLGASCGLSEGYLRKGMVRVAESGLDQKALSGQTVTIADAQTDQGFQYQERAKAEGIHSILVVPLMVEDKAVGVLRVYSGEPRQFDAREIQFAEAAANLSAIALENARLHKALKRDYDLLVQHEYRLDDN